MMEKDAAGLDYEVEAACEAERPGLGHHSTDPPA